MDIITKKEELIFIMLFNRAGYVLNFNTNDFDKFTMDSIGEKLCEKYGHSKGKSLIAYLNEASDEDRSKLMIDLFEYYELYMEFEYNKEYVIRGFGEDYNEKYAELYKLCKTIIDRINVSNNVISTTAVNLKVNFSSEYISKQIDLMISMQAENPTNAIGIAKELIESCCKTILDDLGVSWSKTDDVPQLTNKTLDALSLLPSNIQATDQGVDSIKAILGNLRAIPSKLAELRNPFGSGHGKSASFEGLEERHAKLAVGSSVTFVEFVWSTYENQKNTGTSVI